MFLDVYSMHDEGRHIMYVYQIILYLYVNVYFIHLWLCFAEFTIAQGKIFSGLNKSLSTLTSKVGIKKIVRFD